MHGVIRNGFLRLGTAIAVQPRKTALIVISLSLIMAAGWSRIFVEDRPELLYTPQASRAFTDKQWVVIPGVGYAVEDRYRPMNKLDSAKAYAAAILVMELIR